MIPLEEAGYRPVRIVANSKDFFMRVEYTCQACKHEGSVAVVPRQEVEDVKQWVERVARIVNFDHQVVSPRCTERKVDLKIPLPKDDNDAWIGKDPGS